MVNFIKFIDFSFIISNCFYNLNPSGRNIDSGFGAFPASTVSAQTRSGSGQTSSASGQTSSGSGQTSSGSGQASFSSGQMSSGTYEPLFRASIQSLSETRSDESPLIVTDTSSESSDPKPLFGTNSDSVPPGFVILQPQQLATNAGAYSNKPLFGSKQAESGAKQIGTPQPRFAPKTGPFSGNTGPDSTRTFPKPLFGGDQAVYGPKPLFGAKAGFEAPKQTGFGRPQPLFGSGNLEKPDSFSRSQMTRLEKFGGAKKMTPDESGSSAGLLIF